MKLFLEFDPVTGDVHRLQVQVRTRAGAAVIDRQATRDEQGNVVPVNVPPAITAAVTWARNQRALAERGQLEQAARAVGVPEERLADAVAAVEAVRDR